MNDMYPMKQLMELGVPVGFGSDWPVSSVNPLEGIEVYNY
jgi:predicted amidohydrolase YtcJ